MAAIRGKLASRALAAGDRLHSVRRFAEIMGVSPSTVVEAYGRLEAAGVIRARRGSGFYVAGPETPPMALSEATPASERAVDPFWVSRQALDADEDALKPGCGWMPTASMPNAAIRKALRNVSRSDGAVLSDYGSTRGSARLRRLLLGRFAEEGLMLSPDQLMLTGSGTDAIDLLCRLLLRPGDTVLIDDPCYFNFQALLRAHQVTIAGIAYTPTGPDIAAFEEAVSRLQPRLYITNSALHNPTGATISPQTDIRLLRAAGAAGLTIIEDEIFAEFEPAPSPRLAVLDGLEQVIRIGSFSKTLSASIRCGYIAARPEWIEALVDLQVATRFGGPSPLATEILAEVLAGGTYRKHIEALRNRLTRTRRDVAEQLASIGIVPWITPRGGFYLWCRLPEGKDSTIIAKRCMTEKIILAPGNVFSATQSAAAFMRFNVTQMAEARILPALRRAME
ncbi:GntR family transcriptional regulator [Rhizobium rhizosphaerae]|uniref:GntR family transcriptional regulator n=1 Tax=Xaviernesmea rhizosphaerae TaxID=1672749 RepID=A0ABX3P924_9HYPH|nr:PLP-dependent aminotransferase family protein [Xaviernesmea rhizosphaerae]OQP84886.1 GntR family transcriptional regulator [Xaviernesmea rhizosphaerae]